MTDEKDELQEIDDIFKNFRRNYASIMRKVGVFDSEICIKEGMLNPGRSFAMVWDAYVDHKPIRHIGWAKGVFAILADDNMHIEMHYEDEDPALDHTDLIEGFSASDLAQRHWIEVFVSRRGKYDGDLERD